MNYKTLIALFLAIAFLTEAASARRVIRPHRKGPSGSFQGVITAVAGNTVRINAAKDKDGDKELSFWTDDGTSVSDGDKQAKLADLKTGLPVTIKASNGYADSITVNTGDEDSPKAKKKDKKKDNDSPKSDTDKPAK